MAVIFDSSVHYKGNPCRRGHEGIRLLSNGSCVHCTQMISAKSYEKNIARRKSQMLQWHVDNPGQSATNMKRFIERGGKARWFKENRKLANSYESARRAAKKLAIPQWADLEAIKKFYEECPAGMHVDHIVPLQSDLVCGLHCEGNLQYLTENENLSKGNRWWPDMPE